MKNKKSLFKVLRNKKGNNTEKQNKKVEKFRRLFDHIFDHKIELFGITFFDSKLFWETLWEQKNIIPTQIKLEFLGFELFIWTNANMFEVAPNRFEDKGDCWSEQSIGINLLSSGRLTFKPFFMEREKGLLFLHTIGKEIRKRKHISKNGRWFGEWKSFVKPTLKITTKEFI